jgi:predicted MPP superfamily phosphohydrolase
MFALFSFVTTIVVFALLYLWSTRTFPVLARRRWWVAGSLVGIMVGQAVTRHAVVHGQPGGAWHTLFIVLSIALVFAGIPIGLMHVTAGILERRRARGKTAPAETGTSSAKPATAADAKPEAPAPPRPAMTRRQVVEATGGLAILGATGTMLGWGAARGRHAFELVELPVRIAGLPRALDGYVIAQVSDIHTGNFVGERELDEGFELVRRAMPDLVVVTGDHVDFDKRSTPLVARKLADLAPRDGVWSCLGNHDDYAGGDEVAEALRAAGITCLVNDGRIVRPRDGGGFALLGVDDLWSDRYGRKGPRLDLALGAVPASAPRILLSHQPHTIDFWAGRVSLQLSGHTHGGQINPGFRPADLFLKYVSGSFHVAGTHLYVNRGFGTVGPPSRIGAPPEVTKIVLVAA